jgi:hypothetical protein
MWAAFAFLLAVILTQRIWREPTPERLLQASFALLVWFWATGPVCNPWYLVWAMPMLPFVANRGWLILFAIAPSLFLRFAFLAQRGERGEYWFDHFAVFAITGVWVAAVIVGRVFDQRLASNSTGTIAFSDPERKPSRSTLT